MNNVLVTGCNGQLGSEIRELATSFSSFNFFFTNLSNLDITDHKKVHEFISSNNINTIINCAAYTAVDKAEDDHDLANAINHLAVKNFAKISKEKKISLVHISTDYVFDGTSSIPYIETDETNPQSVYGQTKLEGELAIKRINPSKSIIIRTSWVYSKLGNNFVKTMLCLAKSNKEISVIDDQIGSPTNAFDLAKVILNLFPKLNNRDVEVFHYCNGGECSWFEFVKIIFEMNNLKVKIKPIKSKIYKSKAKRPFNSTLDTKKIKKMNNLNIPHWKDSLLRWSQLNQLK